MFCYRCQASLENVIPERGSIGRYTLCPQCHSEVRVCLNCKHFDPTFYNECREPVSERVVDKEKANFCELFSIHTSLSQQKLMDSQENAKKGFNDLFQ